LFNQFIICDRRLSVFVRFSCAARIRTRSDAIICSVNDVVVQAYFDTLPLCRWTHGLADPSPVARWDIIAGVCS
jgi:hypothetical protein